MTNTVKGFGIVNKTKVDVFLELFSFLMIQGMSAIWNLVPLPFQNSAWTSGSSQFTFCWSLARRILSITLLVWEMSAICSSLNMLWHCVSLGWNESWHFPVLQPWGNSACWVFQICWHTECSTFTASSFRIWNSSTGIPLLLLALFIVMLPKAHLTSHARMSGSRSMITPSLY